MAVLRPIFRQKGVTPQEAEQMVAEGWHCMPNVAIRIGGSGLVAVPGEPPGEVHFVDLWVGPDVPMMPQLAVIHAMVQAEKIGADLITLSQLCQTLFHADFPTVRNAFKEAYGDPPADPVAEPQAEQRAAPDNIRPFPGPRRSKAVH